MFLDELMIGPDLTDLKQTMFFYEPSIIFDLSLAIFKSHQFMFGLYPLILL